MKRGTLILLLASIGCNLPASANGFAEADTSIEQQIEQKFHPTNAVPKANTDLKPNHSTVEYPQDNGNKLTLSTGWQKHFGSVQTLEDIESSPLRKSDTVSLSTEYQVSVSESWQTWLGSSIELNDGIDSSLTDNYNLTSSFGIGYIASPSLKLSLGIFAKQNSFEKWNALPMLGLDWNITDRLRLQTFNGAFLSYDLGKSTEIDIGFQVIDQTFAVENLQGTVFLRSDQSLIMEDKSLVGTLGVRHRWKDIFSIRAFAELSDYREIQAPVATQSPTPDTLALPEVISNKNKISFGVEGGIRF